MLGASVVLLQACSFPPHVEDWQRDRISEIPDEAIEVAICFNHNRHSKQVVYDLARDECAQRITEVENLVQTAKANGQNLYSYFNHILKELPKAEEAKDFEALLPHKLDPKIIALEDPFQ